MSDEFVKRVEFDIFAAKMNDGFEKVFSHIDTVEKNMNAGFAAQKLYIDEGFEKVFGHIDSVEKNLNLRMDRLDVKIDNVEKNLNARIDKLDTKIESLASQVSSLSMVVNRIASKIL